MYVKQISVFVQNTPGRLKAVVDLLAANNIDIRALSLSDTNNFGILRLIVADPEASAAVLRSGGCSVRLTDVLAVEVNDRPGGMAASVDALSAAGLNIEYLYAFISRRPNRAYVIYRVDDIDRANQALIAAGIRPVEPRELYEL